MPIFDQGYDNLCSCGGKPEQKKVKCHLAAEVSITVAYIFYHYIIWYCFGCFAKYCIQWSVLRSQEEAEESISSVDATVSTPASHQQPASKSTDTVSSEETV